MSLKFDKWIIGSGLDMGAEYIVHTEYPRFIGMVQFAEEMVPSGITEITFMDDVRPDAMEIARLMRQAGDAAATYYAALRMEDDDDEQ